MKMEHLSGEDSLWRDLCEQKLEPVRERGVSRKLSVTKFGYNVDPQENCGGRAFQVKLR